MPKRISQLPAASLPLQGDEEVVLNQNGITVTAPPSAFGGSPFPLVRTDESPANIAANITWTTNTEAYPTPQESDSRIRGTTLTSTSTAPENNILLMEGYVASQWQTALSMGVVQDFCDGDYPAIYIDHLIVNSSVELPGGYVTSITAGQGISPSLVGGGQGNTTVAVANYETSRVTTSPMGPSEIMINVPMWAMQPISVGDSFRMTAYGTCNSSNTDTVTFRVRNGVNGLTTDPLKYTAAVVAAGSGSAVPFKVEIVFTVRTVGSTGTLEFTGSIINNGDTGIIAAPTAVFAPGSATFDSLQYVNFFDLTFQTGGTNTGVAFQNVITESIK